jgi:hypothetical protein
LNIYYQHGLFLRRPLINRLTFRYLGLTFLDYNIIDNEDQDTQREYGCSNDEYLLHDLMFLVMYAGVRGGHRALMWVRGIYVRADTYASRLRGGLAFPISVPPDPLL